MKDELINKYLNEDSKTGKDQSKMKMVLKNIIDTVSDDNSSNAKNIKRMAQMMFDKVKKGMELSKPNMDWAWKTYASLDID